MRVEEQVTTKNRKIMHANQGVNEPDNKDRPCTGELNGLTQVQHRYQGTY